MTGHAIGRFCCCLLAAGLVWLPAHAADTATDSGAEAAMQQLIKTTSADLDKLYKEHRTDDRAALETLIENDILPSVDRVRITRRVFRQYWSQLVKAGRQQEAEERVINALTRTYAAALSGYAGDTINLFSVVDEGRRTTAKSRIRRPNGQTIQVDFSLNNSSGQWKIDDMAVDGIVVSLTLFNAVKSVWDQQGMEAALNSIGSVDVNGGKTP
jgi:phospholipid transport system substrate-binding protein